MPDPVQATVNLSSIPPTFDMVEAYRQIAQVIPEDLQSRMDATKTRLHASAWELGDEALEVYALVKANGLPYTKDIVCQYVASYMDSDEHSAMTILDFARVCAAYDNQWREFYGVLPFSHFRYAMKFKDPGAVLDKSLEWLDQDGRLPSKKRLQGFFENGHATGKPPLGGNQPAYDDVQFPVNGVVVAPPQAADPLDELDWLLNRLLAVSVNIQGVNGHQRRLISQIVSIGKQLLTDLGRYHV